MIDHVRHRLLHMLLEPRGRGWGLVDRTFGHQFIMDDGNKTCLRHLVTLHKQPRHSQLQAIRAGALDGGIERLGKVRHVQPPAAGHGACLKGWTRVPCPVYARLATRPAVPALQPRIGLKEPLTVRTGLGIRQDDAIVRLSMLL
jgi:hypothetical protein